MTNNTTLKPLGCLTKNIPVTEWTLKQKADALDDVILYLKQDTYTRENPYAEDARTLTLTNGRTVQWVEHVITKTIGDTDYGYENELVYVAEHITNNAPPTKTFLGLGWHDQNEHQLWLLNEIETETLLDILTTVSIHRALRATQKQR